MYQAASHQSPTGHDAELHRNAFNAAFSELGLAWFWDSDTHHRLQANEDERERIRIYLETQHAHLLKAYDADFLVNAIHNAKQRRLESMSGAH
ncbi:MAG TPA: hypothetical protein PK497_02830 [Burkholderiaceae bacterium]|nr:hypothetical protein [Burkholderiaceae bacterium]